MKIWKRSKNVLSKFHHVSERSGPDRSAARGSLVSIAFAAFNSAPSHRPHGCVGLGQIAHGKTSDLKASMYHTRALHDI